MKNIILLITILLLVSCNKEERQIYDTWEVYESYWRNTNLESWQLALWQSPDCKITKDSWSPYIEGKCTSLDGDIILEEPDGNTYYYVYYESIDEIEFNVINSESVHCFKRKFRR